MSAYNTATKGLIDTTKGIEGANKLAAAGAKVNARSRDGWTALMAAAGSKNPSAVRLLLAAGADVNARTKDGRTALMASERAGNGEITALLRKAGAR